jgi:hypothetical protein
MEAFLGAERQACEASTPPSTSGGAGFVPDAQADVGAGTQNVGEDSEGHQGANE